MDSSDFWILFLNILWSNYLMNKDYEMITHEYSNPSACLDAIHLIIYGTFLRSTSTWQYDSIRFDPVSLELSKRKA